MSKQIAYRNAHRAAGSPYTPPTTRHPGESCAAAARHAEGGGNAARGARGSCLALWSPKEIRKQAWFAQQREIDDYHARLAGHRWSQLGKEPIAAVHTKQLQPKAGGLLGLLDGVDLADLKERCEAKRWVAAVKGDKPIDPLLQSWVETIYLRMGIKSVCFFTGSYADRYGYPHGLMLARNVQADFKRALTEAGFDNRDWFNAVEAHKTGRDILHCHALIADMSPQDMALLEATWTNTRGWSKAVRCHDGGINYCSKYILKSNDDFTFDWSWNNGWTL